MTREERLEAAKKYNELFDKYYEKFGENYGVTPADPRTREEIMDDMRRCIETNTKQVQRYFEGVK